MNSQDTNSIKIKVGVQYLKDLSVENPNSPEIFILEAPKGPNIDVKYDISVNKLSSEEQKNSKSFEVILSVKIHSKIQKDGSDYNMFILEAKYAGVFSTEGDLNDVEEKRVLFVYAPNNLFPFLRRIVADSIGNCGFPPLMLDPIDFAGQFEKRMSQEEGVVDNTSK